MLFKKKNKKNQSVIGYWEDTTFTRFARFYQVLFLST